MSRFGQGGESDDSSDSSSYEVTYPIYEKRSKRRFESFLIKGTRNELVLLGAAAGVISLFLPFIGWSAYDGYGILNGGGSYSGISLLGSKDLLFILGFIIFVASLAMSLLKPILGLFGLLGMWYITISGASDYVMSVIPTEMQGYLLFTHWAIGYYIGWAAVLIILTGLLPGKKEIDSARLEKGLERKYEFEPFSKGHL